MSPPYLSRSNKRSPEQKKIILYHWKLGSSSFPTFVLIFFFFFLNVLRTFTQFPDVNENRDAPWGDSLVGQRRVGRGSRSISTLFLFSKNFSLLLAESHTRIQLNMNLYAHKICEYLQMNVYLCEKWMSYNCGYKTIIITSKLRDKVFVLVT